MSLLDPFWRLRCWLRNTALITTLINVTDTADKSTDTACRRWYAVLMSLIVAQGAYAMSSTAESSRELSFYDAPYWVTITIPESRDTFQLGAGYPSPTPGGRLIAGLAFTPPSGGPPNQTVNLGIYDRGRGKVESVTLPINPTLQEFVVEYNALMADFVRRTVQPNMGSISTVKLGDRIWFTFRRSGTSSHRVQYWTPLDEKKLLVLDWRPPHKTFFNRNREAKKLPEIESMLASIRVSREP